MNETTSITTEFPSAATVPFPYESPYKVQTELMSAILNALRQCQQQDKEEESYNGDNHSNSNSNSNNKMGVRNNVLDNPKKRRATIIMLESPTGTGKSLSLACASMAWLKYRENADLSELLLSSPSKNDDIDSKTTNSPKKDDVVEVKAVVSPSPSSPSSLTNTNIKSNSNSNSNSKRTIKKYDWIEAWKPSTESQSTNNDPIIMASPSSQQPTTPHSPLPWEISTPQSSQPREEKIRIFAMENRSALNQELNGIRARLDRLTTVASFAASQSSSNIRQQERTLRDNLVRSGVASALAKERKLNRQLARRRSGKVVVRGNTKRRKTEYGSRGVDGAAEEEDFLLDDYHSEEEGRRGDVSSDSEDDDQIALNDLGRINDAKKQNSKSKQRQQQQQFRSSKALLEGSNLDGSGYKHDPETNARTTNHSTTTDIPTVGSVSAGTGLRKIVYAARTHSQLSQFISELRRTHWGKDVKVVALGSRSLLCSNEHVLYSNKSDKKNSRRGEAEITEMCLDMQKNKRDGAKKQNRLAGEEKTKKQRAATSCPYLASSEAVSTLAMHSLARPSDIEDMANLGKASHACSYYASREALAAAEVVVLPYNTLLSPQARQSVGLSIKNALVVIDEAHNIPETLRNISSCMLSLPVAKAALSQLLLYTRKYSGRLAGRNVFYLGQIRRILSAMIKYLKRPPSAAASRNASEEPNNDDDNPTERKEMMAAVDLMFTLKLDNINLFAILRYLEKSRLAQKLLGFVNHATATTAAEGSQEEKAGNNTDLMKEEKTEFLSKHVSAMSIVETFLDRLCGTSREGKIIVQWPSSAEEPSSSSSIGSIPHPTFRFVQIHSASQLDNVVNEAHAIVLAGGTLRPFTHVAAELFGDDMDVMSAASHAEGQLASNYDVVTLPPNDGSSSSKTLSSGSRSSSPPPPPPSSLVQITPRLTTFTCGHVIPSSNVLTACLSSGPTSKKLDFRHTSRSSGDMIDELGRAILNLCNAVPKGFVVFLPSYKYESQVFQRWRSTGLLSQIGKKKSVHREPKNSRDVEAALARYSDEASRTKSGALLFSVMGGKMSEGINFANELARCVLVAGLPFADITDPVLQEKMQSLDRENHRAAAGMGITGQAYYQNLCMRTVNQSVGRAIRHANDYAAIVLADFRYATDARIWRGLPQWLRRGRGVPKQEDAAFGKVMKEVRSFFSEK